MIRFTEQLHTLIAAPYPFVTLVTHEEDRVTAMLRQLCSAMDRHLTAWRPEEFDDPATALDAAIGSLTQAPEGTVTILFDAHPYLRDPARIRRIRACAGALMGRDATVFFVSPESVHPIELAKDHVVVDVPFPDRVELESILTRALGDIPHGDVDTERLSRAALGLTSREALRAFRRTAHLAELDRKRGRAHDWETSVVEEKRRLMAGAGALEFNDVGVDLGAVGGLEELKRWVDQRRNAFSDEARAFGLPAPRGLLMLGVQGCGKSLAAKALAGYWGLPLVRLDLGALFAGNQPPEPSLRAAMRAAEAMSPCVLWVDEIEKGFPEGDAETSRLLGTLLTWLQEKKSPVFFVATANSVTELPPELLRRGRFDEVFFVDLPDLEARREILSIHLRARGRDAAAFDVVEIAQATPHYSGAELEQIVVAALYAAFGAGRQMVQGDLVDAAREMVPLYALREAEIKALRAWAKDRARPAGHDRSLVDLFTN